MVRSRRSLSKEDTQSLLADSGISLSSPLSAQANAQCDESSSDGRPEEPRQKKLRKTRDADVTEADLLLEHYTSDDDDDFDDDDDYDDDFVVGKKSKVQIKRKCAVRKVKTAAASAAAAKKPTVERPKSTNRKVAPTTTKASGKDVKKSSRRKGERQNASKASSIADASPTAKEEAKSSRTGVASKAATSAADENGSGSETVTKKSRKVHVCNVCQKEFVGTTDLRRHRLIHTNERPFQCEQCGKKYRQAVNLKNHIISAHEGQKQFACPECPRSFALKERLRLHMRLHSGETPYACRYCEKRYARGGQLQQHMVAHHKSKLKQLTCDKCTATFSSTANLRAHMERHEQGPDHYCEICDEHFANEVMLRTHVNKLHYKMRQFDCEVCKKTIEDDDLATHMKSHSNVKMHVCEVCNSYFTQKSQYNVHMRMHTGERPYQCKICWQTFAHSSVLKLHIRKHTGEKPFRCLLCKDDVAFSQLAHLKTHMKKIHKKDNPYMCEGCHEFFKIKVSLEAHQKECKKCDIDFDQQCTESQDLQTLSHLRFLLALLIKKISSEQKLQQLGYEKRLIDNVLVASLKLANRKTCDDAKLTPIERMRLNITEFLNWIVPDKVMENFRQQSLTVDIILDKIVTMYMKQK